MRAYKLTGTEGRTQNDTQWGVGITHTATGNGTQLCTADVIHVYTDPLLAVFADPIHGQYGPGALLWECETSETVAQDALKAGVKSCTTVRQIPKPVITTDQRVEIAIRCALAVLPKVAWAREWRKWADRWLDGTDRSSAAADAAARATYYAARAAARAAAHAAHYAAYAAARATYYAARAAARAAYYAAHDAADAGVNVLAIIKQVVQEVKS